MKEARFRKAIMKDLRGYVNDYRRDGYIDEDVKIEILYANGNILRYPDKLDEIKFKNIINVHIQTADDSQDFNYDSIISSDEDILDSFEPTAQLVVEDMEEYYKGEFLRCLPEYFYHRAMAS